MSDMRGNKGGRHIGNANRKMKTVFESECESGGFAILLPNCYFLVKIMFTGDVLVIYFSSQIHTVDNWEYFICKKIYKKSLKWTSVVFGEGKLLRVNGTAWCLYGLNFWRMIYKTKFDKRFTESHWRKVLGEYVSIEVRRYLCNSFITTRKLSACWAMQRRVFTIRVPDSILKDE